MGIFSFAKRPDAEFFSKTDDVNLLLSAMLRIKPGPDSGRGCQDQDALNQWLDTDRALMRILVRSLGKTLPASAPSLIQVLQDKRWGLWKREKMLLFCPRSEVIRILGKSGDRNTFDALSEELVDADSLCREAATSALGDLGDPRALKPLVAALADPSGELRHAVIAALGRLGDSRAVDPLLAQLASEGPDWLRPAIISALGAIGDRRAVQPLLQAYAHATGLIERDSILEALGKIGDPSTGDFILAEAEAAHRGGWRPNAELALARLRHPRAAELIEARLKNDGHWLYHQHHLELLQALYTLKDRSIPVAYFVPFLDKIGSSLERNVLPRMFDKRGPLFSPERAKLISAALGNFLANFKNAVAALPGLINTGDTDGLAELKGGLAHMCRDYSDETMMNRLEDVCGPLATGQFSEIVAAAAAAADMF